MSRKKDTIEVDDKHGRRRFIRTGAAFLLAGAGAASAQEEEGFRSDCDSQGGVSGKNAEAEGSDNDAGATADRPGCGTKPPVMTEYNRREKKIKVGKVIG